MSSTVRLTLLRKIWVFSHKECPWSWKKSQLFYKKQDRETEKFSLKYVIAPKAMSRNMLVIMAFNRILDKII